MAFQTVCVILKYNIDFPILEPLCGCKCLCHLGLLPKSFDSPNSPKTLCCVSFVLGQMKSSQPTLRIKKSSLLKTYSFSEQKVPSRHLRIHNTSKTQTRQPNNKKQTPQVGVSGRQALTQVPSGCERKHKSGTTVRSHRFLRLNKLDANAHGTQPYTEIPPPVPHALLPRATCGDDWAMSARNTLQTTGSKDGLWKCCFVLNSNLQHFTQLNE